MAGKRCQGRSKTRPRRRSKSRPSRGGDSFVKAAVSGAGERLTRITSGAMTSCRSEPMTEGPFDY